MESLTSHRSNIDACVAPGEIRICPDTAAQIDRHCVRMTTEDERRYWTALFGVESKTVSAALAAVGSNPKRVEQWIFLETRIEPKRCPTD